MCIFSDTCCDFQAAAGGDLNKVKKVVKLVGFVNCGNDFYDQPKVCLLFGFPDAKMEVPQHMYVIHQRATPTLDECATSRINLKGPLAMIPNFVSIIRDLKVEPVSRAKHIDDEHQTVLTTFILVYKQSDRCEG